MNTAKKVCQSVPMRTEEKSSSNQLQLMQDLSKQKAEIESLKKLIGEKIKDPTLAKKAALILSEMLYK